MDAQDKDALKAIPLLSHAQLSALDAACEMHTQQVQEVLEDGVLSLSYVRL